MMRTPLTSVSSIDGTCPEQRRRSLCTVSSPSVISTEVPSPRRGDAAERSWLDWKIRSSRCEYRPTVTSAFPRPGYTDRAREIANLLRIRTSENLLPQPLPNQHLQIPLVSAESKGLTARGFLPQPHYFQHLREDSVSVENTRLITPLDSALTRKCHRNPFRIRTSEKHGGGGVLVRLTRNPFGFLLSPVLAPNPSPLYGLPGDSNLSVAGKARMGQNWPSCPPLRAAEPPAPPQSGGQRPRRNS
jgi:hypothetical protein